MFLSDSEIEDAKSRIIEAKNKKRFSNFHKIIPKGAYGYASYEGWFSCSSCGNGIARPIRVQSSKRRCQTCANKERIIPADKIDDHYRAMIGDNFIRYVKSEKGDTEGWVICASCGCGSIRRLTAVKYFKKCTVCTKTSRISEAEMNAIPALVSKVEGAARGIYECPCGCGVTCEKPLTRKSARKSFHGCLSSLSPYRGVTKKNAKNDYCVVIRDVHITSKAKSGLEGALIRDQLIMDLGLDIKLNLSKAQIEASMPKEKLYMSDIKFERYLERSGKNWGFVKTVRGTRLRVKFSSKEEAVKYRNQYLFAERMIKEAGA